MKHAGYAHPAERSVTLRLDLCAALEHPEVSPQTANAVYVLAHEEAHVEIPSDDEWAADQYAVLHFGAVAKRFGFGRIRVRRLWKVCPYR